jgi:ribose transport system ATP-binding protein
VTFDIGRGEILGFAGLVGSGRSEVAQAIFGVDRAMDGEISIDGRSVTVASPRDAIAEGIYLVPEDRRQSGLVVDMTIRENITLPSLDRCSASGLIQPEKERKRAEEISARLNVKTPSVEEKAANLSGGNQQKVALAKWLALEPQLLIFDEPTRGVDVGSKSEIYAQMRALAQKGVAIMMISSDMEEILGVSDRVAVMHEGAITGFLQREQCSQEAIMRLAVGRHTS